MKADKHQDYEVNYEFVKAMFEELNMSGVQEMMTEEMINALFTKLYNKRGLYVGRVTDSDNSNARRSFGACPFCQSTIYENETKVYCAECSIPHHEDCWLENGRCALYGCTGRQNQAEPGAGRGDKEQLVLELSELPPEDQSDEYDLAKEWERIREGMTPVDLPVEQIRETDEESISDRLLTIVFYSVAAGMAILVLTLVFSAL